MYLQTFSFITMITIVFWETHRIKLFEFIKMLVI